MGGFVVLRANPAVEFPAAERWREALRSAFVVSAATHVVTETEAFADVLLPLSLTVGESDGTMISLDRRYQLLEKAVSPPGEAREASQILLDLARTRSDDVERFSRHENGPHVAMEEWHRLSAGTPLDASGIGIDRLRRELGVKWPCLNSEDPGIERIGATTSTEARLTVGGTALPNPVIAEPRSYVPTPVPQWLPTAGAEYPFLLMGGVLREHFHSRVRTGLTPELHYDAPVARIEMHPFDGSGMGLKDGQWVTLTSEWGQLSARIWLTDRSPRGLLFIPEHFGFLSDIQGGTDTLKEPEGLFHLVTSDDVVGGSGAPAGWIVPVAVRPSRRRDMRKRGLRG
jgi:anaerobic selenocysteine-containing dehydrogenase